VLHVRGHTDVEALAWGLVELAPSHWREVDERSVRAMLYQFTENATYKAANNQKPSAPNRQKIGDLLDALVAILNTDVDQPSWLND
jgi:hypothetical protein